MARTISFVAASSVGNEPLLFSDFRSTRLSDSTAWVVSMIFRIAALKAKKG